MICRSLSWRVVGAGAAAKYRVRVGGILAMHTNILYTMFGSLTITFSLIAPTCSNVCGRSLLELLAAKMHRVERVFQDAPRVNN